jgi:hypothetical protein
LKHFTPEDKEDDDTDHHKLARTLARKSVDTTDDKYFNVEEIRRVITSMDNKKAPGIDRITGEVYKSVFGIFPKKWKTAEMIPIVKPGKENCDDASKFRPISLINI